MSSIDSAGINLIDSFAARPARVHSANNHTLHTLEDNVGTYTRLKHRDILERSVAWHTQYWPLTIDGNNTWTCIQLNDMSEWLLRLPYKKLCSQITHKDRSVSSATATHEVGSTHIK